MKNYLFLVVLSVLVFSCKKEKMENPQTQIVKSEDSAKTDISTGYARLYVLLHNEADSGSNLTIHQKDISATCYTGEPLATSVQIVDRIHPVVFNHVTSPIQGKLVKDKYFLFFVKKGYKYEVITGYNDSKKSCVTFDDSKEEFYQQFF